MLVVSLGIRDSGIPRQWGATSDRPGVFLGDSADPETAFRVAEIARMHKKTGDIAILSVHWGGNWGFSVDPEWRSFAHSVIDNGNIDIVFGHSCNHVKPIEVYKGHLIIYGAGWFLNDYEGINHAVVRAGTLFKISYFSLKDTCL